MNVVVKILVQAHPQGAAQERLHRDATVKSEERAAEIRSIVSDLADNLPAEGELRCELVLWVSGDEELTQWQFECTREELVQLIHRLETVVR